MFLVNKTFWPRPLKSSDARSLVHANMFVAGNLWGEDGKNSRKNISPSGNRVDVGSRSVIEIVSLSFHLIRKPMADRGSCDYKTKRSGCHLILTARRNFADIMNTSPKTEKERKSRRWRRRRRTELERGVARSSIECWISGSIDRPARRLTRLFTLRQWKGANEIAIKPKLWTRTREHVHTGSKREETGRDRGRWRGRDGNGGLVIRPAANIAGRLSFSAH